MDCPELKKIGIFFEKPLDKFEEIVYNLYRCQRTVGNEVVNEPRKRTDSNARVAELADAHV